MIFTTIDRTSKKPLTQQIYEQIRNGILNKELKEGQRLYSSRELASMVGVSRNTVLTAYDRLISEGYIEVRPKAGTYVSKGTSIDQGVSNEVKTSLSEAWENAESIIDFKGGKPAIDHFPRKKWGQLARDICLESPPSIFGYGEPSGMKKLRTVLATYLQKARGVQCIPEQIVITSGATQGLRLITELLKAEKERIAVEDPVTDEMRQLFMYADSPVVPVPVDEDGILPSELPKEKPAFVFVIPSHQFPLGGILSIQRRLQLIEYARIKDCFIVEDDYDSEFTYEVAPVPSIQGIAPDQVIYVGTFSKILSPALRIGYVILPISLIKAFQQLKWFTDRHTSSIEQLVLARFIEEGHLDRHIRKMRRIYKEKRAVLVATLQKCFPHARIIGKAAGMHLVVEIPGINFTVELKNRIKEQGVSIYPVEQYSIYKGRHREKIVLGYGGLTPKEIEEGVHLLKDALSQEK